MGVPGEKSELRKRLLSKRNQISEKEWSDKSDRIIEKLQDFIEENEFETIHTFVSMNSRKEVNTHNLIRYLLELQKKVIVPKTNFSNSSIEHYILEDFNELEENSYGILEPQNYEVSTLNPELILVPLLASDKNLNRLGYGKGFYDRFLKGSNSLKVGLLFDDFVIDEIPTQQFDIPLDILITEKKMYSRNKTIISS